MPDIDDINDAIAENAADGIASVTVAGQTTIAKSVDEQIKAANHIASKTAASKPHMGLRFFQFIPPGGQ